MNKRLATAIAAYTVLGVVASFVLHGLPLYLVLGLFASFAIRSIAADRLRVLNEPNRDDVSQIETPNRDSESENGTV
jgi:hypothetical protein